jgi:hypothetical protein
MNHETSQPAPSRCPIHALFGARGSLRRRFGRVLGLSAFGIFTLAGIKCIILYVILPAGIVTAFGRGGDNPDSASSATETSGVSKMPVSCPLGYTRESEPSPEPTPERDPEPAPAQPAPEGTNAGAP